MKEPTIIKDLELFDELLEIILNTDTDKCIYTQDSISIEEVIEYSKKFLRDYDSEYLRRFLLILNQDRIVFQPNCYSTYNTEKNIIRISSTNMIGDAFVLIHELAHYVHIGIDKESSKNPFREAVAIMHEKMLSDYLCQNYSFLKPKSFVFIRMQCDNYTAELGKMMLNYYIKSKKTELRPMEIEFVESFSSTPLAKDNLDNYAYYLLGSLFSAYIHNNTINKNFIKSDLKRIRNFIMARNYSDLSSILDLDFTVNEDGFNISDRSIRVLEKAYRSEVKYYGE